MALTTTQIRERAIGEWIDGSGIDRELAEENVLTYATAIEGQRLTGWKRFNAGTGYWACHSIEPRTGKLLQRGEIKLFEPRKIKSKTIKYIAYPSGVAPAAGLLKVPMSIWERVAHRYQVPLNTIAPDKTRDDNGFWKWVIDQHLPIVIVEGRKKAAALLGLGYVGISINGCWNSTTRYDASYRRIKEEIQPFLQSESSVIMCYDADITTKPAVAAALSALHDSLKTREASLIVSMAVWPSHEGNGIDDVLVNQGSDRVHQILSSTITFQEWEAQYTLPDSFEDQVIERLAKDGHEFIYCYGAYHKWCGTHYERVQDGYIKKLCYDVLRGFKDPSSSVDRPESAAKPKWVKAVSEQIQYRFYQLSDEVDKVGYLNCLNGLLEINCDADGVTTFFKKRNSDDRPLFTSCAQINYDPDADPTHWNRLKSMVDEPQRTILLKILSASFDLASFRKYRGRNARAIFLIGDGSNGKDTLRNVLEKIFHNSLTTLSVTNFQSEKTSPLKVLHHSRINWQSETPRINLDTIESLKAAITGDPITIDPKYSRDPEEIYSKAIFIFGSNNEPSLHSGNKALKSRYAFIHLTKTFTDNPDPKNIHELKADSRYKENPEFLLGSVVPAALNDLLQHLDGALRDGIDYSPIDAGYETIRRNSEHLLTFIDDVGLTRTGDTNDQLPLDIVWRQLAEWYVRNEYGEITNNGKTVTPFERSYADRFDEVVTSSRRLSTRLKKLDPNFKTERVGGVTVAIGWTIQTPLHT